MTDITVDTTSTTAAASGAKLLPSSLSRLSLDTVNRALVAVTLAVAFVFVATLTVGVIKLLGVGQHIRNLESKGAKLAAAPSTEPAYTKPAPVDPALSNRNIFQPAGAAVTSTGDAGSTSGASAYRLVGISAAKDPADTYVMVENSQTKLTYFLQYGQPVEGLELERILEDKVIVKIGGKAVEFE